jgi:hypothetical protein
MEQLTTFLITVLTYASIGNIIATQIQPLEHIKEHYHLDGSITFNNNVINYIYLSLVKLINCPGCISFWTSLFMTHSISIAAITYITASLLDKKINSIEI